MKVYKVELMIIDFDHLGKESIEQELENVNYPNDCINPKVMNIIEKDIGEWSDNHPLNKISKQYQAYKDLFG